MKSGYFFKGNWIISTRDRGHQSQTTTFSWLWPSGVCAETWPESNHRNIQFDFICGSAELCSMNIHSANWVWFFDIL